MICTLIAIPGAVKMVAITSSQETNSSYKMDKIWETIASAAGHQATINTSTLSDTNIISRTDILLIAIGTTSIRNSQLSNIFRLLRSGRNIYIQSEYLLTFDRNIPFQYLLDKTGCSFAWDGVSNK